MKQALILVGGKGTRLAALFPDRPKALVPVRGKPFIERQIEWLASQGFTHVHLAAGHMAGAVADWAARASIPGVALTVSVELHALGTGGGLKFVRDRVTGDVAYVLNGDSWLPNLDFQSLDAVTNRHSNAWMVLAAVPIEDAGRYGTVEFEDDGRITAFREKAERSAGWINGGVYRIRRDVLGLIPDGNVSLETEIFPRLAQEGRLYASISKPPLLDMGTPDGLAAMERFIAG